MEIPIIFEAEERTSPSLKGTEKSILENRPRVFSDPQRLKGFDYSRTWKIPITIESHIGKKKEKIESRETGELDKSKEFLPSKPKFSFGSPLRELPEKAISKQSDEKSQKKSEAYFEIPIHFAANKNKNRYDREGKKAHDTDRDVFYAKPNQASAGSTWRDAQHQMFTPEKPQRRSEISFEILPGKKMVAKSGYEDDKDQYLKENMANLSVTSSSSSHETRQKPSGLVEEAPSLKNSTESPKKEAKPMAEQETLHVAYTKDEIGVMRGEISKLEKIAEIMKNAAVVWSQVSELSGESKDNEQKLKGAEEMLTKGILELDEIEVNGNEQIRCERKKAVEAIEKLLQNLEENIKAGESK